MEIKKIEHEHKHEHSKSKKSNVNNRFWIMAIALVLLIVISGVQAVELVTLKNKLNDDLTTITASAPKKSIGTGSSGSLQNNLQDLPSMVGGC